MINHKEIRNDIEIFLDFLEKKLPEKKIYVEKFKKYHEKIIKENEKMSLVSKKDIYSVARKHFLDSVLISNFIEEKEISDIGSGAGFPGIIISILNPDKRVYLIERNLKKSIFLKEVKIVLSLENVKVIREDILNMQEIPGDAFVSRAANYKKILKILKDKNIKDKNFYAVLPFKENIKEKFYIIENPLTKENFKLLKIKI